MKSPRAWGWTDRLVKLQAVGVEIPTRVGMDRRGKRSGSLQVEIPTRVGMDRAGARPMNTERQRSPRAWGWTEGTHGQLVIVPEIPTRVGMDR